MEIKTHFPLLLAIDVPQPSFYQHSGDLSVIFAAWINKTVFIWNNPDLQQVKVTLEASSATPPPPSRHIYGIKTYVTLFSSYHIQDFRKSWPLTFDL